MSVSVLQGGPGEDFKISDNPFCKLQYQDILAWIIICNDAPSARNMGLDLPAEWFGDLRKAGQSKQHCLQCLENAFSQDEHVFADQNY